MQHGGAVDHPHHLAARPVIFGDAEGLAQLVGAELQQPRADGGHREGVPGAGGVIVRDRAVQGDAGPRTDLIAQHQRRDRLRRVDGRGHLGEGDEGGDRHHADMALGRVVAVMAVEIVDLGRRGEGGPRRAHGPSVEHHAGRGRAGPGREGGDGEIPADAGGFQLARRRRHADGVEQEQRSEMPDLRRNARQLQLAGKAAHPFEARQSGGIHGDRLPLVRGSS